MARCFVDGRRRFPAPRMSSDSESFRRFVGLRLTRTSFDQRTLLDRSKSLRGHHDSRRVRRTLLAHSAVSSPDLRGIQGTKSDAAPPADLGHRSHGRGPVDYLQRHPSPPWPSNDRSGTKNGDDRFRRIQTFSLRQVGKRCYPGPHHNRVQKAGVHRHLSCKGRMSWAKLVAPSHPSKSCFVTSRSSFSCGAMA